MEENKATWVKFLIPCLCIIVQLILAIVVALVNRPYNPMTFRATTILEGEIKGNPCIVEIVYKNDKVYYYTETITYNINEYTEVELIELNKEIEERVKEYRNFNKKSSCLKHNVEYTGDTIIEVTYQDTRKKGSVYHLFYANIGKAVIEKNRYRKPCTSFKKTIERLRTEGFEVVETIDKNTYSR